MDSGKPKEDGAKARIDRAVTDLIADSEQLTPSQLKRILREVIPAKLSGALLLSFLTLLATAFGLGWKGHQLFQEIRPEPPPPIPIASPTPPVLLSPRDTVYRYFTLLDQGNHEGAWQMIAPPADGKPADYEHWIGWWSRVERVSVREIGALSESPFQAIVRYRLEIKMKDRPPTLDKPSRAVLFRDSKDQPWKILRLER